MTTYIGFSDAAPKGIKHGDWVVIGPITHAFNVNGEKQAPPKLYLTVYKDEADEMSLVSVDWSAARVMDPVRTEALSKLYWGACDGIRARNKDEGIV